MCRQGAWRLGRWLPTFIFALSILLYATMAPFGYALFALVGVSPWPPMRVRARFLQGIVRRAFVGLHTYLRLIRFLRYTPTDHCPADVGACVIIANHPSLTDALAILASIPHVCTAVRADLYDKYWLRPLLLGCGHFSAGTSNPLSGLGVVTGSVERLTQGFRVLLFPEGTRSPVGGGLRPFGRSAFSAACKANVPVVALLVREQPSWLAKGSPLSVPREGTAVKTVELLKVAKPEDFLGDSRLMRDYVEALYREALGLSPAPAVGTESYSGVGDVAPLMKAIGE
jgi:1-acyl-sn-glycerol-3-phosphate acyltransferase